MRKLVYGCVVVALTWCGIPNLSYADEASSPVQQLLKLQLEDLLSRKDADPKERSALELLIQSPLKPRFTVEEYEKIVFKGITTTTVWGTTGKDTEIHLRRFNRFGVLEIKGNVTLINDDVPSQIDDDPELYVLAEISLIFEDGASLRTASNLTINAKFAKGTIDLRSTHGTGGIGGQSASATPAGMGLMAQMEAMETRAGARVVPIVRPVVQEATMVATVQEDMMAIMQSATTPFMGGMDQK